MNPMIPTALADHLRRTNPALLQQLEAAATPLPQNTAELKTLTDAETQQLKALQSEMNEKDCTPERRGTLAVACLKLRGLYSEKR